MANDAYALFSPVSADHDELARLIHHSTNAWYERHRGNRIFDGDPLDCRVFPDLYAALDPGQAIALRCAATGVIAAACYYHPRESHASLGIMNVHPGHSGRGLAGRLLRELIRRAEGAGLPLRLVSSAMNLDSYSLYTRHGFSPVAIYQDMLVSVPVEGFPEAGRGRRGVRPAVADDLSAIVALEEDLAGLRRPADIARFIANPDGFWRVLVAETANGAIHGYLTSSDHPASRVIGPGVARDETTALALALGQLDHFRGRRPLVLVPADRPALGRAFHDLGARNCEIHFAQVRGSMPAPRGVTFPTFLPESG